jgi:hypothetical protein
METLIENAQKVFSPSELNEIILIVYKIITWAIRARCDMLTLTPTHFIWSRGGQPVGQFQIDTVKPSMSYLDALEQIIERDAVVQRYLHLASTMPQEVNYHITLDDE